MIAVCDNACFVVPFYFKRRALIIPAAWILNVGARFRVVPLFVTAARTPSMKMMTSAGYLYPRAGNAGLAVAED